MIEYSEAVKAARLSAISNAIDDGLGPAASLTIYTGPRPASGEQLAGQTAIVSLAFPVPSAQSIAGGILTLAPLVEAMATGDGVPAWARIVNRDGVPVADLDVGAPGSGADIVLQADKIYRGALISIMGATITEP